jgi:hypothetical protein
MHVSGVFLGCVFNRDVPPPLMRLEAGLRAIGRPLLPAGTLPPGGAGKDALVYGNPFLSASPTGRLGLDVEMPQLAASNVRTLGDLLSAKAQLLALPAPNDPAPGRGFASLRAWRATGLLSHNGRNGILGLDPQVYGDLDQVIVLVQRFLDRFPSAWVERAEAELRGDVPPLPAPFIDHVDAWVRGAFWQLPRADGTLRSVPVSTLHVRDATALQLADWRAARAASRRDFVLLAGVSPVARVPAAVAGLRGLFSDLWRLDWNNRHKGALWRLACRGVRTLKRMHVPARCYCGHGPASPGRSHVFWECTIARAVRAELELHLPAGPVVSLARHHLWLGSPPPHSSVSPGPWRVVCCAALTAMEASLRALSARAQATVPAGSPSRFPDTVPAALVDGVAAFARVRFWAVVSDFCGCDAGPASWQAAGVGHPYLGWHAAQAAWVVHDVAPPGSRGHVA